VVSLSDLPLDHLQLDQRAFNAALNAGCKSVADVIETAKSGALSEAAVGKKTVAEIQRALSTLKAVSGDNQQVDWQEFWSRRGIALHRIALVSATLQVLGPEIRESGLGSLHLRKACSGLTAAGITTVGALVDAVQAGMPKLRNFGATAHKEVVKALTTLSRVIQPDGSVDWCKYANLREFPMIPANEEDLGSGKLLRHLPEICETIVNQQFDDRAWQIFRRRLLVPDRDQETLESLASVYDVTRERIRQVEGMCLDAIKKPLFENDYYGLAFRLRPQIGRIFQEAREHFDSLGVPAWCESVWIEELALLWHVKADNIKRYDRLFAELLGYQRARLGHVALEALLVDEGTSASETTRLTSLVDAIHDVLNENNTGLDAFRLTRGLKKVGKKPRALDEIPVLVELCSSAEAVGEDLYRLRFGNLKGRSEQVYRVLSERGEPQHYSDLIREINRQLPVSKRIKGKGNLVNQSSKDSRLEPIGKTGKWALSEWNLETRPIVDVIEDILTSADEALTERELTQRVLQARPGAESSVTMLLQFNPKRFRKVGPHLYGLASWGDAANGDEWWSKDKVADFVCKFFAERKGASVEFSELNNAFMIETGLSSRSARGVLSHHPAVEIERPDQRRRIARLRPNWKNFRRERLAGAPRILQAESIVKRVIELLSASSTGEAPLIKIVIQVQNEMKIGRPNIYAAISQSEELENIPVEGTAFKICRLRGGTVATFPQIDNLQNPEWREECKKAVAKLSLEEVDIALFMLGRQFDQALRNMLEVARDCGLPVLEGHLARIQNRIDWALTRGVFRDKATLNLLRLERNERGHEPPTVGEQRAIMKFAPFLAELYIDYLLLIEHRIASFRGSSAASLVAIVPDEDILPR